MKSPGRKAPLRRGRINRLVADTRHLGSRPPKDIALLVEAVWFVSLASLATKWLPFRWITAYASRRARTSSLDPAGRAHLASRVSWAVRAASRRSALRAVCLEQGLAAQAMLRRRGVSATLYYGAATDHPHAVKAHVWVKDGEIDVIGTEVASQYAIVGRFPASPLTDPEQTREQVGALSMHEKDQGLGRGR